MPNELPVSLIVSVGVNLSPNAAQAQSLSDLLIMGTSTVIDSVERYRQYASIAEVASDFGTSADEYLAAVRWFAQRPQPTNLLIGRWFEAASRGGLRCAPLSAAQQAMANWTGITTGSLRLSKDGAGAVDVTAINLSACANLAAVAAAIQAGTNMPAGVTVTWNSVYGRFEFESTTTGPTSSISFLTTAGSGVDISDNVAGRAADSGAYIYSGEAIETAATAIAEMDVMIGQRFYATYFLGLTPGISGDNTELLAVADYIEAANNKHVLGVNSQEAGAISPVSTTDFPYLLAAAGYLRTICQYSSTDAYAVVSALARILTVNYEGSNTAITLKFKDEPGVTAENLTSTQAQALTDKNCNVFVAYNNDTNILQQGVCCSGEWIDTLTGTDWLALTIQRDVYNVLYTSTTKVPQTDEGMNLLKNVVEGRCAQGVVNGLLAPGVWNSDGFGLLNTGDYLEKGYYVYSIAVSQQSTADRAARMAVPIQVAVKLAGAIHSADVTINVNN